MRLFAFLVPLLFVAQVGIAGELLSLDSGLPCPLSQELRAQGLVIPYHPLIPQIRGGEVNRATYRLQGRLKLRWEQNGTSQRKTASGEFWQLMYVLEDLQGEYGRKLLKDFRSELIALGGTVLEEGDGLIMFRYTDRDSSVWGRFEAYSSSLALLMVQER